MSVVSSSLENLLPGVALLGGFCLSLWLWVRKGQEPGLAFLLMTWAVPLVLAGGKVLYLLERGYPISVTTLLNPGYSLYGSFFLVVLFWIAWALLRPFPLLVFLDCVTPGAAFALVLGRVNCFINGCCGGTFCDWPWAVRFRPGTAVFEDQWERGLVDQVAHLSLPVHPTQLYEAAFALVFGLILFALVRRNLLAGVVFFSGMLGYSLFRFVVEPLRIHPPGSFFWAGWSLGQLLSVSAATASLVCLTLILNRQRGGVPIESGGLSSRMAGPHAGKPLFPGDERQ